MLRPTRLEVDLDRVAHNLSELRRFLKDTAPPGQAIPKIAPVVKADAYGLGALAVAGTLLEGGADLLAVACLPEAIELRRAYPQAPILVMGHTPGRYFPEAVQNRITLTIFDLCQGRGLSEAAAGQEPARVHLKIDTGMNRLGLKPDADSPGLLDALAALPGLAIEGVFTHLALDSPESDRAQVELFLATLAGRPGLRGALRHVCDSIGLARYPDYRLDLVRPGAILYGVPPLHVPLLEGYGFAPPWHWKTEIARVRRLKGGEGVGYDFSYRAPEGGALIATLPVGYADGYKRSLSNRGQVLVRGVRAPVVGLICMDQLTVDVSAVPEVAEGDEVTLLGPGLPVLDLADWASTNRNDIIASIGRRVPRAYLRGGRPSHEADYLLDQRRNQC